MIAIKQSKLQFGPNKIQEKSIKNTKAPTTQGAASEDSSVVSSNCIGKHEEQNKFRSSIVQRQQQQSTKNQPTKYQQTNETKSEIKQTEGSLQVAPCTLASKSPLAPSAESAAMAKASANILTAPTKIQQRQQKFLAAAAKSATSPQRSNYHHNQPQHNAWQSNTVRLIESTAQQGRSSGVGTCCSSVVTERCQIESLCASSNGNVPELNQQLPSVRCCPLGERSVVAYDKNVPTDNNACEAAHRIDGQHRPEIVTPVFGNNVPVGGEHLKKTRVTDGMVCDQASDKTCSAMSSQQPQRQQQQKNSSAYAGDCHRKAIDCAADTKITRVAALGATSSESSLPAINGSDVSLATVHRQSDGSEKVCEYRHHQHQLLHNHHLDHLHYHSHQHQQPYDQAEVRRSCEHKDNKDEDDDINIKKNTIKHNNHYYYNHNNQHNYPHLQYQPAQQITTTQNQSTATVHQPQQVMAHYKFHNDCQSSVLTYEQVKRLDLVMDQVVPVHGRGNAPTLFVKLKELIRLVKHKLQHEHSIEIRDVRLNGGAASYVLAPKNSHYNDLDLVFGTDLSSEDRFDVIRNVVLECLMEFYPKETEHQEQLQTEVAQEKLQQDSNAHRGHLPDLSPTDTCQSDRERNADVANDDTHSDGTSSRSNRSSSFESDNLNITSDELDAASDDSRSEVDAEDGQGGVTEEDDDEDDEDSNIIVRIDSEDDSRSRPIGGAAQSTSALGFVQEFQEQSANQQGAQVSGDAKSLDTSQQATVPQQVQYQYLQMPPNNCAIREAYVHKMVKVNDDDRWSLISLGVQQSETNNYNHMQQQQQQQQSHNQDHSRTEAGDGMPQCCVRAQASSPNYKQQGDNYQQNQPPNSIELKFVDRMRRKFEFSVDSFQIILDSLIQFYDYAPQSTITIQRKLSGSRPSPNLVNIHPMNGRRSSCSQCCSFRMVQQANLDQGVAIHEREADGQTQVVEKFLDASGKKKKHARQHKSCGDASINGSQSYYDLPLEPGNNSLSNSSVASSSGCSSSSSVVSSSSSSLSCDEDNEDLYCDVDNSSSSSASTSSLLSSTTTSVMSSTTNNSCDRTDPARFKVDQVADVSRTSHLNQRGGIQSSTTSKHTKKHTSKNDCTGSQCSQVECDFEMSKLSSCAVISENFYPTVIGRSEYGNFKEALYHLEKKLIATRSPEEIRGGGLLKYCNLLVKNYKPTNVLQIRTLERYMCSRFFIDFSDLNQQRAKLESYLANHFSDDPMQKFHYLTILHNVVQRSTVCLMNHELRLTLNMIRELAYELNEQQRQQQQQQEGQSRLHLKTTEQRLQSPHQQPPLFSHPPHQLADQPQTPSQQQQYQQQQKPTVMQSGVYRVKLVNYALAKPIKS